MSEREDDGCRSGARFNVPGAVSLLLLLGGVLLFTFVSSAAGGAVITAGVVLAIVSMMR